MNHDHALRFVVLRHQPGARFQRTGQVHFDWMFEVEDGLRTWAAAPADDFDRPLESACEPLAKHRKDYLDREGSIAGGRGTVTRVLFGTYAVVIDREGMFVAQLQWTDSGQAARQAWVQIYRNLPDARCLAVESDAWRLRFFPGRYETNR